MRNIIIAALLAISSAMTAQTETTQYTPGVTAEGAVYFLPKTSIRIAVKIEKTTYTPGEFSQYAQQYLKIPNVVQYKTETNKICSIDITSHGVPDKTKGYAITFDPKTSASNIELSDDGILLAINAEGQQATEPEEFKAAPKQQKKDPREYLSEEILSAGSTAKMAELIAQDIYEIRESWNLLTRGQADFMPKDGEQLRLMLKSLETQDKGMTQMFTGTTEQDTTEHIFYITPDKTFKKQILFRLSKKLGIVDHDNLAGEPYYIDFKDLTLLPEKVETPTKKKVDKNGVFVNVPGKAKMSIYKGNNITSTYDVLLAQYGHTEFLSGELFNKRYTTHLILSPITGAIIKLDAEMPK